MTQQIYSLFIINVGVNLFIIKLVEENMNYAPAYSFFFFLSILFLKLVILVIKNQLFNYTYNVFTNKNI